MDLITQKEIGDPVLHQGEKSSRVFAKVAAFPSVFTSIRTPSFAMVWFVVCFRAKFCLIAFWEIGTTYIFQ